MRKFISQSISKRVKEEKQHLSGIFSQHVQSFPSSHIFHANKNQPYIVFAPSVVLMLLPNHHSPSILIIQFSPGYTSLKIYHKGEKMKQEISCHVECTDHKVHKTHSSLKFYKNVSIVINKIANVYGIFDMCQVCKRLTSNSSFNPHNGSYAIGTSVVLHFTGKETKGQRE